MRRIFYALILSLLAVPAYAQQWDQVNGSMQVRSGPSSPLVIIDQTNTSSNNKILSLRANGTEKCSVDVDGDLVCAGSFTFVNLTFTGQAIGPLDTDCSAPAYSGLGALTTGVAVRTTPSVVTCVGGAAIDLTTATARTMQSTFTFATSNGSITATKTALATTSTDGIIATNTTAATGGATVQMSPRLKFRGNAWDTAASQTVDFFLENLPATAATPTGTLKFGYSLNGGGATYPMALTSAGALEIGTIPATAGTLRVPNGGGVLRARNNANNANIEILGTTSGDLIEFAGSGSTGVRFSGPSVSFTSGGAIAISATAPTIASGFCTTPAVSASNGTGAFAITIGTGCAASTGTVTMPAATTGWSCSIANVTSPATNNPKQTGGTTTTVTVTNYAMTTGLALNFTDSESMRFLCLAY